VIPVLAMRVARRAGDFEIEMEARRAVLDGLATSGVTDPARVRAAVGEHRTSATTTTSVGRPASAHPPAAPAPN
jgi:hypothetical protein